MGARALQNFGNGGTAYGTKQTYGDEQGTSLVFRNGETLTLQGVKQGNVYVYAERNFHNVISGRAVR